MSDTPTPGSAEAIKAGCTCPVIDNRYGEGAQAGYGSPSFFYTVGCPVHPHARNSLGRAIDGQLVDGWNEPTGHKVS